MIIIGNGSLSPVSLFLLTNILTQPEKIWVGIKGIQVFDGKAWTHDEDEIRTRVRQNLVMHICVLLSRR